MTKRQKKRFWVFACAIMCILGVGTLAGAVYAQNLEKEQEDLTVTEEKAGSLSVLEDEMPDSEEIAGTEETIEAFAAEETLPEDWNLILVNKTHLVPDDFEVELKEIGDGHQIDARIYEDYRAMIAAAKKEGVYIYVTSSYRDMEKQTELHENKIEAYVMEGYSYMEAKELAAEVVAIPGTSEHQLGLALDLVSSEYRKLDEKQETTKGFQWLKEHCWEYGFILRYPNGKTDVTGIIYEPWHFRYVGEEAAEVIMKAGITLEEYLGAKPVSEEEIV